LRITGRKQASRSTRRELASTRKRWQELGANGEEERDGDESALPVGGRKPLKRKPGRGSGMKQARKAAGGANRRGRAKRRGRNVGRAWELDRRWTPVVDVAKRYETPRKALGVHVGQVTIEESLKESEAHERMIPSS
jgi:hypothetical protein